MSMQDNRQERLIAAIAAYGAEASRWPEELRAELERAVRDDPVVAEAWRREAALDAMLAAGDGEDAPLPGALRARILHAAPQAAPRRPLFSLAWVRAAGAAATLAVGVIAGFAGAAAAIPAHSPELTLLEFALDDPAADYESILPEEEA